MRVIDLTNYDMQPLDGVQFFSNKEALDCLKRHNKIKSWEIIKDIKPTFGDGWKQTYTLRPREKN